MRLIPSLKPDKLHSSSESHAESDTLLHRHPDSDPLNNVVTVTLQVRNIFRVTKGAACVLEAFKTGRLYPFHEGISISSGSYLYINVVVNLFE